MSFWRTLIAKLSRSKQEPEGDPADNPFSDENDFSARERTPLPPRWLRQREEDPDTVAEMRRESGDSDRRDEDDDREDKASRRGRDDSEDE